MAKGTKRMRNAEATSHADFGPRLARKGARIEAAWKGANIGILELAEMPDIARPDARHTVRVARRVDPLNALLGIRIRDGKLDGSPEMCALLIAANRLRDDTALGEGARGQLDGLGLGGIRGSADGVSVAVLDAQTRVRRAWQAIRGPENDAMLADIVRCVVLGWATQEAVQQAGRCRRGTVRDALLTGLSRLADHYDASGRH